MKTLKVRHLDAIVHGATAEDLNAFLGKKATIHCDSLEIAGKHYPISREKSRKHEGVREVYIGLERFEEDMPTIQVLKKVSASTADAFIVIMKDRRLGIVLKNAVEETFVEVGMVWCEKHHEVHEPPACEN